MFYFCYDQRACPKFDFRATPQDTRVRYNKCSLHFFAGVIIFIFMKLNGKGMGHHLTVIHNTLSQYNDVEAQHTNYPSYLAQFYTLRQLEHVLSHYH